MKTDRELLELAAKAVGAEWQIYSDRTPGHWSIKHIDGVWREWKPLEDDGDALRLAVKLGMDICNPHQYNVALATIETKCSYCGGDYSESFADISECTYAGVRRAIVLAAAKIGGLK